MQPAAATSNLSYSITQKDTQTQHLMVNQALHNTVEAGQQVWSEALPGNRQPASASGADASELQHPDPDYVMQPGAQPLLLQPRPAPLAGPGVEQGSARA